MATNDKDFVPFDPTELAYFGCKPVIDAEHAYLKARRAGLGLDPAAAGTVGLAFSGGGIRSASFCLGVMQGLAEADHLKRVDYLSTVSGGSYIGTTLSWLLSQPWPHDRDALQRAAAASATLSDSPCNAAADTLRFSSARDCFPLASEPMARDAAAKPRIQPQEYQGRLLAHLRQSACYLAPGKGITLLSLLALMVRNAFFGTVLVGGLLAMLFLAAAPYLYDPAWFAYDVSWLPGLSALGSFRVNNAFKAGVLMLVAYAVYSLCFSVVAWAVAHSLAAFERHDPQMTPDAWRYSLRHFVDRAAPRWLKLAVLLLVLGLVPTLTRLVQQLPWEASGDEPSWTTLGAAVAGFIGALASFFASAKQSARLRFAMFGGLAVILLPLAILTGLFSLHQLVQARWDWTYSLAGVGGLLLLALGTDINALSVHRYYRDRLMETFMPWVPDALRASDYRASPPQVNGHALADTNASPGSAPLHLINTHVVLAHSGVPKFRQRGGDNFIFTPLYSGSNATGWVRTVSGYRTLSLASVMAMSGAAVNPNAGFGGMGITRTGLLSIPMRVFNLRLGYWVKNPGKPGKGWRALAAKTLMPRGVNALWPGLAALFNAGTLDEGSPCLEITDGGHFENTAIYELLRRRCRLIIACDAGDDRDFSFGDLNNVLEKARVDFGVRVDLFHPDFNDVLPRKPNEKFEHGQACSPRPYLTATIHYANGEIGQLLFITTVVTPQHTADIAAYQRVNPAFPDQTTGDQFFDERQFEAYRELGFQSLRMALRADGVGDLLTR
jgi:predicted acylesterase/phospholipase RssA